MLAACKDWLLLFALLATTQVAFSQNKTVSGKVSGKLDNSALPGVSVLIKGTTSGTTTDNDGNYSISVPATNATLIFTFTGFESQQVKVGNESSINISLQPANNSLGEVVVIGYGTVKKRDLTGSVASAS